MKDKKQAANAYMKYTGLAFQIFFLLFLGWFVGSKIDEYFIFEKPYFAVGLAFVMLIGFFVKLYYDLQQGRL